MALAGTRDENPNVNPAAVQQDVQALHNAGTGSMGTVSPATSSSTSKSDYSSTIAGRDHDLRDHVEPLGSPPRGVGPGVSTAIPKVAQQRVSRTLVDVGPC